MVKLTERERSIINLAKKGYNYKKMAKEYGCSYYVINHVIKGIYKKLEVRSMTMMLHKVKIMDNNTPIFDIAKEEWEKLYPMSDPETMSIRERDFSWQHWLRAWQTAEKRFK